MNMVEASTSYQSPCGSEGTKTRKAYRHVHGAHQELSRSSAWPTNIQLSRFNGMLEDRDGSRHRNEAGINRMVKAMLGVSSYRSESSEFRHHWVHNATLKRKRHRPTTGVCLSHLYESNTIPETHQV
ncbi:hypothetical protein AAMO2058_001240500 [Amorphochlora amoebiformis]